MAVHDRPVITGMKRLCGAVGIVLLLAGCDDRADRVSFNGNYYPSKSSGAKTDRRDFTASVSRASQDIAGAKLAVIHEATRYCLQNFGTSDIGWAGGSAGSKEPVYTRAGQSISVSGRCVIW